MSSGNRSAWRATLGIVALELASLSVLSACGRTYRFFTNNLVEMGSSPSKLPSRSRQPYRSDARLAVLWVGHATALVQLDDRYILTDPIFTSTAGQLSQRLVEPGIAPENLPRLDAVIISHLHLDHLSLDSLEMIHKKVRWLTLPTGGLVYLTDFPFRVSELAPWQSQELDGLRITAVPVRHSGWRYGLDAPWMKRSATGYVVEYHGLKVYFGGDTGYVPTYFKATAEQFPGLDLALLPIAPISPPGLMRRKHMDPAQALRAFSLLRARNMVPIHFDTFVNSTDDVGYASLVLRQEMVSQHVPSERVAILGIGEQRVLVRR